MLHLCLSPNNNTKHEKPVSIFPIQSSCLTLLLKWKKGKQFSWLQPRIVESAVFKNDLDKSSAWRCQLLLHIWTRPWSSASNISPHPITDTNVFNAQLECVHFWLVLGKPYFTWGYQLAGFKPCTYQMIWTKPFQLSLRKEQGALHTRGSHLSKKLGVGLCQGPWYLWRGNITCFFFLSKFVLAPE